jgi:acyl-CoA synthetase (AMP-forming)/AMP-acid ligase II
MILRKERFNGIAGVNTLFNGLLENKEFCARDFSDLRMVIAGGMATHTAVAKRWKDVTGLPIIEGYGLTECSPVVSISPIDIAHARDGIHRQHRRAVAVDLGALHARRRPVGRYWRAGRTASARSPSDAGLLETPGGDRRSAGCPGLAVDWRYWRDGRAAISAWWTARRT